MTQEELIDKAVNNAIDLLIGPITRYSYKEFADIAIKQYIKLKDMENINLMDRILDLSCSDLTDLLHELNMILKDSHISQRELFNKFGSFMYLTKDKSVNMLVDKNDKFIYVINEGDEVTIYGYKSKADILKAVGLTDEVVNTRKDKIIELLDKIKNSKCSCGINESNIEKVVQEEYTESKHNCEDNTTGDTNNLPHYTQEGISTGDCGDIPQTLDEVDKWVKNQKVDMFGDIHTHPEIDDPLIKHLHNVYNTSNWYEGIRKEI